MESKKGIRERDKEERKEGKDKGWERGEREKDSSPRGTGSTFMQQAK